MTSDAKIGLLLGLLFIFIIAFMVNGLPKFQTAYNTNEGTMTVADMQNESVKIAAKQRKVIGVVNGTNNIKANETVCIEPQEEIKDEVNSVTLVSQTEMISSAPPETPAKIENEQNKSPQVNKEYKEYIVSKGDTISVIAKKFYGQIEGSKRENILKIFNANKKNLRSENEISLGQSLIIPPLNASNVDKKGDEGVFSAKLFEKISSIGQKKEIPPTSKAKFGNSYVVKENDRLWDIAKEKLGDGNRYIEIKKLNGLENEDLIVEGMSLKLPTK